ncbi:hypothetical protein F8M41_023192 [Gigaspora margarita]|uniref:Uncharacterized protein n=1 Tax=Gigaspora margarita TaxID=4874 RepID=A0A8H4EHG4_GIGMA|nr:hypothetical protein F8M41_023192 [Gigaspora margarita]
MLFLALAGADDIGPCFNGTDCVIGTHCNNDNVCGTQICRIVDQDGHKCQMTDTRKAGDACLVDDACEGDLICFNLKCT